MERNQLISNRVGQALGSLRADEAETLTEGLPVEGDSKISLGRVRFGIQLLELILSDKSEGMLHVDERLVNTIKFDLSDSGQARMTEGEQK